MLRSICNQGKHAAVMLLAAGLAGACEDPTDPDSPRDERFERQNLTVSSISGEAPFAVRLLLRRTEGGTVRSCTGVVLSQHWLVTAGHCVRGAPTYGDNRLTIRAGILATDSSADVYTDGAASYYIHPDYSGSNSDMGDDFALIRLYGAGMLNFTPAKIMGETSSAYLPSHIGHPRISGYGFGTSPGASESCPNSGLGIKRSGSFEIVPNRKSTHYGVYDAWTPGSPFITEMRLRKGDRRPCDGDSGAPIYFNYGGENIVAGLWAGTFSVPIFKNYHSGPSIRRRLDWILAKTREKGIPLYCNPTITDIGPDYWHCWNMFVIPWPIGGASENGRDEDESSSPPGGALRRSMPEGR